MRTSKCNKRRKFVTDDDDESNDDYDNDQRERDQF